mgnify:CR=1 FL=1
MAVSTPISSLYPNISQNPAARRAARAGRLPLGRPATRRSRVENCGSSRAPTRPTFPNPRPNSPPRGSLCGSAIAPPHCHRAPGDSFCFGSSPKQLNRLLRRGARVCQCLLQSPAAILVGWPSANQQNMPFYAGGRQESFELDETALRGRRPGDPGGTERYYVSLTGLQHPTL